MTEIWIDGVKYAANHYEDGKLKTSTDPDGETVTAEYDEEKRIQTLTDRRGKVEKHYYNEAGLVTKLKIIYIQMLQFSFPIMKMGKLRRLSILSEMSKRLNTITMGISRCN